MMHKRNIIIAAIALLIVTLPLVYFFAWRPTDSAYTKAKSYVTTMEESIAKLPDSASSTFPAATITDKIISSLDDNVQNYQKSLASLQSSSAIARDFTMSTAYQASKSSLEEYGSYMKDFANSLKTYRSIVTTCSDLIDNLATLGTEADYNKESEACKKMHDTNQTVPNSEFNNQFYSDYHGSVGKLLDAMHQFFVAADQKNTTDKTKARQLIGELTKKIAAQGAVKVTIDPVPAPSVELKKLSEMIDKQQSVFIK